jgi:DNA sulfur modification protein DndE
MPDRFHPSERHDEMLDLLRQRIDIQKVAIARLALAVSLREKGAYDFSKDQYDHQGKEFRLRDFEKEKRNLVRNLLSFTYKRNLSEDEWGELLVNHINSGAEILKKLFDDCKQDPNQFYSCLHERYGAPIASFHLRETEFALQDTVKIIIGYIEGDQANPYVWEMNNSKMFNNSSIAIMGTTGTGKTQILQKILADLRIQSDFAINIIVIDYKGDISFPERPPYLHEVANLSRIDPYESSLPINPFMLSEYTDKEILFSAAQKAELFETFTKKGGMVQKSLLKDAVENAYRSRAGQQPRYPDFPEVFNELQLLTQKRDSLFEMVSMFSEADLFHSHKSGTQAIPFLHRENLIIRLNRLPAYKEIVAFLILERLYREMTGLPDAPINEETGIRQIRACVVIDEAHNYLPRNNEFLDKLIREGRSKGFVTILSSQSPKDFKQQKDYGEFIEHKFIFQCQATKTDIQPLLRVDDSTAGKMAESVMNLEKGWCIFNHSNNPRQNFTKMKASQFWESYK